MAENTAIEWCDSTVNAWEGCAHAGPGCDNCYAESMNNWLRKGENWGAKAPRLKHGDAWKRLVRSWQRNASKFAAEHAGRAAGPRRMVFVNSTGDTFDNEVPDAWRSEIWDEIRTAPDVVFILVTKRVVNAKRMLPADWGQGWPNVIVLATVCNQKELDNTVPHLLALPAAARGLSIEPLLGAVSFMDRWVEHTNPAMHENWLEALDWVICGGESGRRARPMHPAWARSLRDQCAAVATPFFFKQWGEWVERECGSDPLILRMESNKAKAAAAKCDGFISRAGTFVRYMDDAPDDEPYRGMVRVGKKAAGRTLDGREHNGFPKQ
jgi:protein gp37